jgi:hypothetical protein
MPHVNPHRTRPIPLQHTHTHNIIQPRIRPVPPRLKLPPQHRPPIRQRKPLRHNHDIRPIMRPDRIARIRSYHALCIGQSPVGTEVENRACVWGVISVMWGNE